MRGTLFGGGYINQREKYSVVDSIVEIEVVRNDQL